MTDEIDRAGAAQAIAEDRLGWAVARHQSPFAMLPADEFGPEVASILDAAPASLLQLSVDPSGVPHVRFSAADDAEDAQHTKDTTDAEDADQSTRNGQRRDAETGGEPPVLEWSYRGHPVFAPNTATGRMLVHALAVLEADALAERTAGDRAHLLVEAMRTATRAELNRLPMADRLSADDPEPLAATSVGALPREPARGPVVAALGSDGSVAALCPAGGAAVAMSRLGRPALCAAAAGDGAVAKLLRLVVQRIDEDISLDAAVRSGTFRLGPGATLRIPPGVAQSVRAVLGERGHRIEELDGAGAPQPVDAAGSDGATAGLVCAAVLLDDEGKVSGAGTPGVQVAHRAASSTASQA